MKIVNSLENLPQEWYLEFKISICSEFLWPSYKTLDLGAYNENAKRPLNKRARWDTAVI